MPLELAKCQVSLPPAPYSPSRLPQLLHFLCLCFFQVSDWTVYMLLLLITTSQYGYCYCHWRIACNLAIWQTLATLATATGNVQKHVARQLTIHQVLHRLLLLLLPAWLPALQPANNLWHVAARGNNNLAISIGQLGQLGSTNNSWKNLPQDSHTSLK